MNWKSSVIGDFVVKIEIDDRNELGIHMCDNMFHAYAIQF